MPKTRIHTDTREYDEFVISRGSKYVKNYYTKLLKANIHSCLLGVTGFTVRGSNNGYYQLPNNQVVAEPNQPWNTPVHLWDLNSVINTTQNTGPARIRNCMGWTLTFTNDTASGQAQWTNITTGAEANRTYVNLLDSDIPAEEFDMGKSSFMRYVDIKLLVHGPDARPGRFTAMLVQFNEEDMLPIAYGAQEPTSGTDADIVRTLQPRGSAFWMQVVQPLVLNPVCQTTAGAYSKYFNIILRKDIVMNSRNQGSAGGAGQHTCMIRLFKWMNRQCRYDWQESVATGLDSDDLVQKDHDFCTVDPEKRVYLLILANSTFTSSGFSADAHFSYDASIRIKHETVGAPIGHAT